MRFPGAARRRYDVAGKVVLITGAGQGIGLALATQLHERGSIVALIDVSGDAVALAAKQLGAERAIAITADVRDREAMTAAVAAVVAHCGGLDVVVANAGVAPRTATLRTVDLDEYDRVIAINQDGVWNTVRPALEQVIANKGHVVVVSSIAAFAPGAGAAPYMISKAAVEQLGRALRIELAAHGASAGVAYFGVVDTSMTRATLDEDPMGHDAERLMPAPLRRRISPEQAATVIADGIGRRAPRTMAPKVWVPYAMLRGAANVLIDGYLTGNKDIHALVHKLEQRATSPAERP